MAEVTVRCEDLPTARMGHRANQKINRRSRNATSSALIAHPGCVFVVFRLQRGIFKRPQTVSKPVELLVLADAGEQFLADGPDHLGAPFANQISQRV